MYISVFKIQTRIPPGKKLPVEKVGKTTDRKVSIRIGRLPEALHTRDLRHEQCHFFEEHVLDALKGPSRTENVSSD